MAYEITIRFQKTIFNEEELKEIYNGISADFSLSKADANKVIKELEGHTGLIIQSGYKDYEFAHKSIHEYLCAEHLVKLPSIPSNEKLLKLLPNELAIATTISSDPSLYFCELILNRFFNNRFGYKKYPFDNSFITTFVNRLVLEKPDFNLSSDISYALVVLYTMLRRGETGQLRLFDFDLPIQFERFVTLIFKRNKKFEFSKYYDVDESYKSETSEPILKLKRNAIAYRYDNEFTALPNFLYAKKSFVSGYNK
jgi:hypothetical protein